MKKPGRFFAGALAAAVLISAGCSSPTTAKSDDDELVESYIELA